MTLPTIGWLAGALDARLPEAVPSREVVRICIDSRKIKHGEIFWAVRGQRDGHGFVSDALASGAACAIVESSWLAGQATGLRSKCIGVIDTTRSLQSAGRRWRDEFRFPVIGITGSNGKTSTKEVVRLLLGLKHVVTATAGNLNNYLGVPLTLLETPLETGIVVIEMGASLPGEIGQLCEICRPNSGLVTSISHAHLEGFGGLAALAQTKGQLYDFVALNGVAFVPTADELCRVEASECLNKVGYSFGPASTGWTGGHYSASELRNESGRWGFTLRGIEFQLRVIGYPSALAALAGSAVANMNGIDLQDCAEALREWPGVPGRMQVLESGRLTVLDDSYNANPGSMRAALNALSSFSGRKIAVLGTMAELGKYAAEEHDRLVSELSKYGLSKVLFVGNHWNGAIPLMKDHGIEARHFSSVEALLEYSEPMTEPAVILVKGSHSTQLERFVRHLIGTAQ